MNKEIKFLNKPNTSHVTNSGETIWHSRSVAVVMCLIVNIPSHGDYVLACKRGPKTMDAVGLWNMPCGYLDWGENGPAAVCREVWEETGVDLSKIIKSNTGAVTIKAYNLNQPWYVDTSPVSNRQNVTLRYGLKLKSNVGLFETSLENNEEEGEISDVMWIPITDLDKYEWAFEHDYVIKEYLLPL